MKKRDLANTRVVWKIYWHQTETVFLRQLGELTELVGDYFSDFIIQCYLMRTCVLLKIISLHFYRAGH